MEHNPNLIPWLRSFIGKADEKGVASVDVESLVRVANTIEGLEAEVEALEQIRSNLWVVIEDIEDKVKGLKDLLDVAECPKCDGSGAFYGSNGEPAQCQWCDEKNSI